MKLLTIKKLWMFVTFLLLQISISSCYAQVFLKYIPDYADIGITNKMIDSLEKQNAKKFFIFLTTIGNNTINDNENEGLDSVKVTYFIWYQYNKSHIILITDSSIYKEQLISDTIFNYPNYKKAWLCKDEDIYQLVCPINSPDNKDILISIANKSRYFFEIGKNVSYKLNIDRNGYRKEVVKMFKNVINQTNNKWVRKSNYNRWNEFFPEKK